MAEITWSQDIFSKGEISPLLYSRITVTAYYNGVKTAKNCITYPQGGIGKRFGTIYLNEVTGASNFREIYFETFQYLNECTYLIVIVPGFIKIYLEGNNIATVTASDITASLIPTIDTTILDTRFRITADLLTFRPKDLVRSANAANVITGVASNEIALTVPLTSGYVYPVRFTTTGALPTTSPQIVPNVTYFLLMTSTTTAKIFSSAEEAKAGDDFYIISGAGSGTNTAFILNTWTYGNVVFRNLPVYDFTQNYDSITFTPAATSGYGVVLTASVSIFTTAYVGGVFAGNGGIARIIGFTSTTQVTVNIVQNFANTSGIPGSQALLAEPAWSDARGWPTKCSSFQSRSVFANTPSLPNGLWLSVTNDYNNFDGLLLDDDDAISYYPTSDNVNFIKFIVPFRSLTVHTNTGIYSTPLSFEQAVTPTNFSMTLQDSTPATVIQPRGIDNQIIIVSGNDVHSMLWDGFNNAYTSTIASIASEHLIRNPHDESEYVDLNKAGSRYMFIINDDGSLVIFQTLISDDVQGFTRQWLEQSYGNAYFRWATGSSDGRGWFITEREIAEASAGVNIIGFTSTSLEATGTNFDTESPTLIQFATGGALPHSNPQIEINRWYWVVGVDADNFKVYLSKEDAIADENPIEFTDAGTSSQVIPWPLVTKFYLEELSFEVFADCCTVYEGVATSTISGQSRFNGQDIVINGNGYGFQDTPIGGEVSIEAHGEPVEVTEAYFGFPINTEIVPLPMAPPGAVGAKGSTMVWEQHTRSVQLMFADTIGGYVNGVPIQLNKFNQTVPNSPPEPRTGLFKMSPMKGWDAFNVDTLTITHSDPFDIKLIGIFYKIEV